MVETLLEAEVNDTRFEHFCCDLYGRAEKLIIVPTSKSWDRGRDGKTVQIRIKDLPILAATLDVGLTEKIDRDIRRLVQTSNPTAIVYCTTQPVSEHAADQIEGQIRALSPQTPTVRVLGRNHIAVMASRSDELGAVVEDHYRAELHALRRACMETSEVEEKLASAGLRLALGTQLTDDARSLREQLGSHVLLQLLANRSPQTLGGLAKGFSDFIGLSQVVNPTFIEGILGSLVSSKSASKSGDLYSITPKGRGEVAKQVTSAARGLLTGKRIIHGELERLTGIQIPDGQYNVLWNAIQDSLSQIFYSQGLTVLSAVSAIMGQKTLALDVSEASDLKELIEGMADRVSGAVLQSPDQAQTIRQALIDMWFDKTSKATEWLCEVAVNYVSICALGLEATSTDQVKRGLLNIKVIPDTDIFLSLLCEGESNHAEIRRLFGEWKKLGGQTFVVPPVAFELAYHAWISRHDFDGVRMLFGKSKDGSEQLIENAFVRAFWTATKGKGKPADWKTYISAYIGTTQGDASKIVEVLKDEYGVAVLDKKAEQLKDWQTAVEAELLKLWEERAKASRPGAGESTKPNREAQDKCRRDAELLAITRTVRDEQRKIGASGQFTILSSSKLLRTTAGTFRADMGEPFPVMPFQGFAYLLSLLPGTAVGVGVLRKVLFEGIRSTHMSPFLRLAMRVIAGSKQYSLPYAQRVILRNALNRKLRTIAEQEGRRPRQVEEDILHDQVRHAREAAEIIAAAVDDIAASKQEKYVKDLERQLKERAK